MRHHLEYQIIKQATDAIAALLEIIAEEPVDDSDLELLNEAEAFQVLDYFDPDEQAEWLIYYTSILNQMLDHEKILAVLDTTTMHNLGIIALIGVKFGVDVS